MYLPGRINICFFPPCALLTHTSKASILNIGAIITGLKRARGEVGMSDDGNEQEKRRKAESEQVCRQRVETTSGGLGILNLRIYSEDTRGEAGIAGKRRVVRCGDQRAYFSFSRLANSSLIICFCLGNGIFIVQQVAVVNDVANISLWTTMRP